jgi:hypothetical protein
MIEFFSLSSMDVCWLLDFIAELAEVYANNESKG